MDDDDNTNKIIIMGVRHRRADRSHFHLDGLVWLATDIERSRLAISVKDGRCAGSGAQHSSISFLHSRSQVAGTGGRNVLFTIPPARISKILKFQRINPNKISRVSRPRQGRGNS